MFILLALVAFLVSSTSAAKAQVFHTEDLPQYEVLSTLYVTTLDNVTRFYSSEDNNQFTFTMPTAFSLWTGPSGVATITDFKKQEWLPFMNGPIVASVDGHASFALGNLEVYAGQSLVLPPDLLSFRNFMLYVGDGDSSFTFKIVKFDVVPEPATYAFIAGIMLLGFAGIRRWRKW